MEGRVRGRFCNRCPHGVQTLVVVVVVMVPDDSAVTARPTRLGSDGEVEGLPDSSMNKPQVERETYLKQQDDHG